MRWVLLALFIVLCIVEVRRIGAETWLIPDFAIGFVVGFIVRELLAREEE